MPSSVMAPIRLPFSVARPADEGSSTRREGHHDAAAESERGPPRSAPVRALRTMSRRTLTTASKRVAGVRAARSTRPGPVSRKSAPAHPRRPRPAVSGNSCSRRAGGDRRWRGRQPVRTTGALAATTRAAAPSPAARMALPSIARKPPLAARPMALDGPFVRSRPAGSRARARRQSRWSRRPILSARLAPARPVPGAPARDPDGPTRQAGSARRWRRPESSQVSPIASRRSLSSLTPCAASRWTHAATQSNPAPSPAARRPGWRRARTSGPRSRHASVRSRRRCRRPPVRGSGRTRLWACQPCCGRVAVSDATRVHLEGWPDLVRRARGPGQVILVVAARNVSAAGADVDVRAVGRSTPPDHERDRHDGLAVCRSEQRRMAGDRRWLLVANAANSPRVTMASPATVACTPGVIAATAARPTTRIAMPAGGSASLVSSLLPERPIAEPRGSDRRSRGQSASGRRRNLGSPEGGHLGTTGSVPRRTGDRPRGR